MKKSLALTNKDGEVRELTAEDISSFKSAKAALPASLAKKIGVRGAQRLPKRLLRPFVCRLTYWKNLKRLVKVGKHVLMRPYVNLLASTPFRTKH